MNDSVQVMGKLDGIPAAVMRGFAYEQGEGSAQA